MPCASIGSQKTTFIGVQTQLGGENASRARKDNSPLHLNPLHKKALALLSAARLARRRKEKRMFMAALNPDMLLRILFSPLE